MKLNELDWMARDIGMVFGESWAESKAVCSHCQEEAVATRMGTGSLVWYCPRPTCGRLLAKKET